MACDWQDDCGAKALVPCPDCEDGVRYFVYDPKGHGYMRCSKVDWEKTPEDYRYEEGCETCNGEGWI